MKILYIYQNKIIAKNGGSLESRKVYHALKDLESQNEKLKVDSLSLEDDRIQKSRAKDFAARLIGHCSYLIFEWQKVKREVMEKHYDLVVLGHSRLGFIARDMKAFNPRIRVISQFHNVEYDYVDVYKSKFHPILQPAFTRLERRAILRDESDSIRFADHLLFMTPQDQDRCQSIYGDLPANMVLPICTAPIDTEAMQTNDWKTNLVFIGALDYPSNIDGLRWFLDEVWPSLQENPDYHLIIGGSKPHPDLVAQLEKTTTLECHFNFESFEKIVPSNAIFLSFVRSTAGMKTKAAEALAAGLMIIATKETYIGYQEALADPRSKGIMVQADSADAFIREIQERSKSLDLADVRNRATGLWASYYSRSRADRAIQQLVEEMIP